MDKLSIKLFPYIFFIGFLIQACSCDRAPSTSNEMVLELQALVNKGRPMQYYHWNEQRADFYKSKMKSVPSPQKRQLWILHCQELLNAGDIINVLQISTRYSTAKMFRPNFF